MTITHDRSLAHVKLAQTHTADLRVRRLGEFIGAEISGVRLSGELPERTVASIRAALLTHRVVFFRDQQHLDDAGHYEFTERLGVPTAPHPTVRGGDGGVLAIDSMHGKANSWHTDVTFVDRVPAISVLRPIQLTTFGGTTAWANTVNAYAQLHPALQAMADRLWAVHTNVHDYAGFRDEIRIGGIDVKEQAFQAQFESQRFEAEHPVVQVHPETGERSLLLGAFTKRLVGVPAQDSHALITLLQRHVTKLENTVRWNWQPGDVAIWDNRATQHYGVSDYADQHRVLHRVTVSGTVPVSVDGVESTLRVGDAEGYSQVS